MNRQVAFALFLIVVDIGYFLDALTLPRPFAQGEPGPAFMPFLLSIVLFVACARILWKELRGQGGGEEDEAARIGFRPRAFALMAATGAFVYLFEPLGYWIATLLYTFAVALLFERERLGSFVKALPLSALMAAGITTAGWLFFVTLFDLMLPEGSF